MNKHISKIIAAVAIAGLVAASTGCRINSCCGDESCAAENHHGIKFGISASSTSARGGSIPLDDQLVELNRPVTFEISDKFVSGGYHRWFFNGGLINAESAPALGVTGYDTSKLKIASVTLANCGFYNYENVPGDGSREKKPKVSQTAELQVISRSRATPKTEETPKVLEARAMATITVVYGTPIGGPGGQGTGCPGPYVGYVNYTGSWSFPNGGQAYTTNNPANAVVYHYGVPSTNWGCNATIPPSPYNYRFKIYFKNTVPSGPYPLTLQIN